MHNAPRCHRERALAQRRRADIDETKRYRNVQGNRLVVKGIRAPLGLILSLAEDGCPERIVRSCPRLTWNPR